MKKHTSREERREERPRGSRREQSQEKKGHVEADAMKGSNHPTIKSEVERKDHLNNLDLDSDVQENELLLGTRNEGGSLLIYETNLVDYHQEVDMIKVIYSC
jgi:hypothetical protein